MLSQARHKGLRRESGRQYAVEEQQRFGIVARHQCVDGGEIGVVVEYVERASHLTVRERLAAERNCLVEHRQRIAHTAISLLSDQVERLVVVGYALLCGDIFEVADAILDADTVEVEDLAARQDRGNDLMLLGCRQDENRVCGWLFESLQEGVERCCRQHMHLIDDVYAVATHLGRDTHLIGQRADILDRVVRCGVKFVDIERATLVERAARLALVASLVIDG